MQKFFLLFFFITSTLCADIQKELEKFYEKLSKGSGIQTNVNSASIYEGQKAGYMTGGGASLRGPVLQTNLATIDLPKINAGCGGIDIYTGGMSFIEGKQLVSTLKSIGTSAAGYSFLLALETVSPQIANNIKEMQQWANAINGISINSCEVAANLVGSVWPKNTMASEHICRSAATSSGALSDYVSSRHKCSQNSEYEEQVGNLSSEYKHLLINEYNIAWSAIQQNPEIANNRDLAELFMTLTGTVVIKNGKDGEMSLDSYPSKVDDEGFLKSLMEGGGVDYYTCPKKDEKNKCLNLDKKNIHISARDSWIGKVRHQLVSIQSKILSDQELSEPEKQLLTKTRLPVYKFINILTAYKKGHCPVDLYHIAEIVAMDLLMQYLRDVIYSIREGTYHLRKSQMYADEIDQYLDSLERIESKIAQYELRSMQDMDKEFQLMQKIQLIEDQLRSEIRLYR